MDKNPITRLYHEMKSRGEVRLLIPMGYVAGLPVITVKNEQLVALVPFLRYKVTGEIDRTLVFPIRYVIEYLVPEKQVVCYRDLSIEDGFAGEDFDKVIGFFRHEAVKNLDRHAYAALKETVLSEYDQLVNSLVADGPVFTADDESKFANDLQTLVEPFVLEMYARLDIDFFNKYLRK